MADKGEISLMSSHPVSPAGSLRSRLEYEPRVLRFGTSGRRGDVVDLTQLEVYINALAELQFLLALSPGEGGIKAGDDFFYASDLRPSSCQLIAEEGGRGEIAQAIEQAILDAGLNPVNLGRIPTPTLTFFAISHGKGSIMVTGSHIPFEKNGYKVNTATGELLKHHEDPVNRQVERVRQQVYSQLFADSLFNELGMFKKGHRDLRPESQVARTAYVQRYTRFFEGRSLTGQRILAYQHSAVGRDLLVEILEQMGAEVFPVGRSDVFVPIDTENIDDAILSQLQTLVDESAAHCGLLDAVVSTDGDSDRPLILGLAPGSGGLPRQQVHFFGGDLVGMIVAEFLRADAVVVPITCNDGIDRGNLRKLLEPKTRIGSPNVIAGMQQACANGKSRVVGWEANGGFLTGSDLIDGERVLRTLPTRDAILPILAILLSAQEKKCPVTSLFAALPHRFSKAALLKKFPRTVSQAILKRYSPCLPQTGDAFFVESEVVLKDLQGEIMTANPACLEGLGRIRQELGSYFSIPRGFALIVRLNWIDGVRIYFGNGDVAHVRPSGNADELRIYAVADSQARADEITRLGVEEPDGILRQLEKVVSSI
jgi:phosphomannomutase